MELVNKHMKVVFRPDAC